MEHNKSIKEFVTIIDKQIGKLKTNEPKENKESKFSTKGSNMVKEGGANGKSKTSKQTKESKLQQDNKSNGSTPKRKSSDRSPLEGNLEKKQKESAKDSTKIEETEDPKESSLTVETMEPLQLHKLTDNLQSLDMDAEHQISLHALLIELKDIKHTIMSLDAKLDKELATRSAE